MKRTTRSLLIILFVLTGTVTIPLQAQPTNIRANTLEQQSDVWPRYNPAIAVNPNNDNFIVVGAIDKRVTHGGNEAVWYYYTTDQGANWTNNATSAPFDVSRWPQLSYSSTGNVYYAFSSYNSSSQYNKNGIYVDRSEANGAGWPYRYPVVENNTTSGGTTFEDELAITTNHNTYPDIQVVWTKKFNNATKSEIWFAKIGEGAESGTPFDPPLQVSIDNTKSHFGPAVAVGPDNYTHIVWLKEGSDLPPFYVPT